MELTNQETGMRSQYRLLIAQLRPRREGLAAMLSEIDRELVEAETFIAKVDAKENGNGAAAKSPKRKTG